MPHGAGVGDTVVAGVTVPVGVEVAAGVAVRVGVAVAVPVGVGVVVAVPVGVGAAVAVPVDVGVAVAAAVGVSVGAEVAARVGAGVRVRVAVGDWVGAGVTAAVFGTSVEEGVSVSITRIGVAVAAITGSAPGVTVGGCDVDVAVSGSAPVGVGDTCPTSTSWRDNDIAPARIIITTPTTAIPTAIERQSSHCTDNRCDSLGRWMTGGSSWYTARSICACRRVENDARF
jgi:hypothetical protein